MSKLILTIGVSGCGKSTYCRDFAAKYNFLIISSDFFREMLCGNASDQSKNNLVFSTLFSMLNDSLAANLNVIVDSTAYNKKNRRELINIGRRNGAVIYAKVFRTPLAICLERQKTRDRSVPVDVIMRQHMRFEYPTFQEFDSIENIYE